MSKLYNNPFYKKVFNYRFSIDTDIGLAAKNIIQYLFVAENISVSTKLDFELLRSKVSNKVDKEDFIAGVFMLTRSDFGVLEQHFEALDEDRNQYIRVMPDDVITMLSNKKYFNPLNGKPLTAEEVETELRTYFCPSPQFIKSLNQ